MKQRKCGCITYDYGPPLTCPKHQTAEEKGLRKLVRDTAESLGHRLNNFTEYESQRGKWTAFCQHEQCCQIVIIYDEPQPHLEAQINGKNILERECRGGAVL